MRVQLEFSLGCGCFWCWGGVRGHGAGWTVLPRIEEIRHELCQGFGIGMPIVILIKTRVA